MTVAPGVRHKCILAICRRRWKRLIRATQRVVSVHHNVLQIIPISICSKLRFTHVNNVVDRRYWCLPRWRCWWWWAHALFSTSAITMTSSDFWQLTGQCIQVFRLSVVVDDKRFWHFTRLLGSWDTCGNTSNRHCMVSTAFPFPPFFPLRTSSFLIVGQISKMRSSRMRLLWRALEVFKVRIPNLICDVSIFVKCFCLLDANLFGFTLCLCPFRLYQPPG